MILRLPRPWIMMTSVHEHPPASVLVDVVDRWSMDKRHPHPHGSHNDRCRYQSMEHKVIARLAKFLGVRSDHRALTEKGASAHARSPGIVPVPSRQCARALFAADAVLPVVPLHTHTHSLSHTHTSTSTPTPTSLRHARVKRACCCRRQQLLFNRINTTNIARGVAHHVRAGAVTRWGIDGREGYPGHVSEANVAHALLIVYHYRFPSLDVIEHKCSGGSIFKKCVRVCVHV